MHENGLAEAIVALASETHHMALQRKAELDWLKTHEDTATKRDLANVEERLMDAIKNLGGLFDVSVADQRLLTNLAIKGEKVARNLEALSAKSHPMPN